MTDTVGIAGDRIRSFVERIEHIEEEIKALNEGKKEIFAEAKGDGFDVKVLKEIIRLRKQDKDERDEQSPCSTCISEQWRRLTPSEQRPLKGKEKEGAVEKLGPLTTATSCRWRKALDGHLRPRAFFLR